MNRSINFKATILGRDAEPTVELPWADKLEDYRNEIGKFMQVIYLPIAVKINDDEPQVIKRLHEEPYFHMGRSFNRSRQDARRGPQRVAGPLQRFAGGRNQRLGEICALEDRMEAGDLSARSSASADSAHRWRSSCLE